MAIGSRSLAGLSIGVLAVFRAAGIGFQNPDAIDLPSLLRARRQRPRGSATEQRDELAARMSDMGLPPSCAIPAVISPKDPRALPGQGAGRKRRRVRWRQSGLRVYGLVLVSCHVRSAHRPRPRIAESLRPFRPSLCVTQTLVDIGDFGANSRQKPPVGPS